MGNLFDVVFILQAPHGHAETLFTDVTVPVKDACLLGEGRGFEIAQGRLGPGRLHHCMRLIGMGERALTLAARRAEVSLVSSYLPLRDSNYLFNRQARVAFGQPLSKNASVLQTLGKMRVRLDGAKLATLDAARLLDAEGNKSAKGAIAACKGEFILILVRAIGLTSFFLFQVAAPAAAIAVIDAAIQIHGALGVCDDTPLARMFAGARTLRLADGPDEVHLETIAKLEVRRSRL